MRPTANWWFATGTKGFHWSHSVNLPWVPPRTAMKVLLRGMSFRPPATVTPSAGAVAAAVAALGCVASAALGAAVGATGAAGAHAANRGTVAAAIPAARVKMRNSRRVTPWFFRVLAIVDSFLKVV